MVETSKQAAAFVAAADRLKKLKAIVIWYYYAIIACPHTFYLKPLKPAYLWIVSLACILTPSRPFLFLLLCLLDTGTQA